MTNKYTYYLQYVTSLEGYNMYRIGHSSTKRNNVTTSWRTYVLPVWLHAQVCQPELGWQPTSAMFSEAWNMYNEQCPGSVPNTSQLHTSTFSPSPGNGVLIICPHKALYHCHKLHHALKDILGCMVGAFQNLQWKIVDLWIIPSKGSALSFWSPKDWLLSVWSTGLMDPPFQFFQLQTTCMCLLVFIHHWLLFPLGIHRQIGHALWWIYCPLAFAVASMSCSLASLPLWQICRTSRQVCHTRWQICHPPPLQSQKL